jgi:manganese efflux pump family protein
MLALLVVAASLGMSNFGAAVGIGMSGVDAPTRIRVGLVFGAFETGMPIIGLVIGGQVAGQLGHSTRWVGGVLLIALGSYGLATSRGIRATGERRGVCESRPPGQDSAGQPARPGLARLVIFALALSLDNLAVGFALGTYHAPVVLGAVIIGAVSVALSLIGLELGARIAAWIGRRGEQLAGLMLIAVGIAIAAGALG